MILLFCSVHNYYVLTKKLKKNLDDSGVLIQNQLNAKESQSQERALAFSKIKQNHRLEVRLRVEHIRNSAMVEKYGNQAYVVPDPSVFQDLKYFPTYFSAFLVLFLLYLLQQSQ